MWGGSGVDKLVVVVVGLCVHKFEARGWAGGRKNTKPSTRAQFRWCRVNWWSGVMGEGGRVA